MSTAFLVTEAEYRHERRAQDYRETIPVSRVKDNSSGMIKAEGIVVIHTVLSQLAAVSTIKVRDREAIQVGIHPVELSEMESQELRRQDVLLGKQYIVVTELPIQATVESQSQLLEGTSPKKTVGETGNGLPRKEAEDSRASYNSHCHIGNSGATPHTRILALLS